MIVLGLKVQDSVCRRFFAIGYM